MFVVRGFDTLTTTQRVVDALSQCSHRAIGGLWGASTGLLIHALQRHWKGSILVVTADDDESFALREDVAAFQPPGCKQPAPRSLVTELRDFDDQVDPVTRGERIRTLELHLAVAQAAREGDRRRPPQRQIGRASCRERV